MRFEKGHKEQTRRHILNVASKRFRKDGISAAGIAGIMGEAGLTNGAFYPHFKSKEDLVREVVSSTINDQLHHMEEARQAGQSLEEMIRTYLSREHLKAHSDGCPSAALLPEIARHSKSVRKTYEEGMRNYLPVLSEYLPKAEPAVTQRRTIAIFALLVGSLQHARVVTDAATADQILESGIEAALLLAEAL